MDIADWFMGVDAEDEPSGMTDEEILLRSERKKRRPGLRSNGREADEDPSSGVHDHEMIEELRVNLCIDAS